MSKLKWRPLAALVAILVLCLPVGGAMSGSTIIQEIELFNVTATAAATDTAEFASRWFNVQGANRVLFRAFSSTAAFSLTSADSDYVDSVQTFSVLFSDSVLFMAVDSLGTIVTARSTIPRTAGVHGEPFPMCADSVMLTNAAKFDTLLKQVGLNISLVNRPLRAPGNGSGTFAMSTPLVPTAFTAYGDGGFGPKYMRVRWVALRRNTPNGGQSTTGERAIGLKSMRMWAYVIHTNK